MAPTFESTVVRKVEDISVAKPQFSRKVREKAASKEKLMICTAATKGAKSKLSQVDFMKELQNKGQDSVLENNVEVETFIENLERHFVRFDMCHFMHHFPILKKADKDESDRVRSGKTVDLFKKWDLIGGEKSNKQVVLKNIGESIQWLKTYTTVADESYLEDLEWEHLYLINSMVPDLRDEVLSTLKHDFPKAQHGGPLTFAVMINKVINLSASAIDHLKAMILSYNIKNVPGENISLVVCRFLYALRRLESNAAIDTRLVAGLYKVFQTTSVDEFNAQVGHMERQSRGLHGVTRTYKEILDEVKDHYIHLVSQELWTGVTPVEQGSTFIADQEAPPQNDDHQPKGSSPYCKPTATDQISSNPLRYQRTIKGRSLKYCAKCWRHKGSKKLGRWNPSHVTDEHHSGKPPAGNDATATSGGTTTGVSFADALMGAQERDE